MSDQEAAVERIIGRQPYTPSPDMIRANYLEWINWANPDQAAIDFERMIEAVRAEEREKALVEGFREGVNFIDNYDSPSWGGAMVAGRHEAARREEHAARIRAQGKEQS